MFDLIVFGGAAVMPATAKPADFVVSTGASAA
jgi:hypothetical protein